MKFLDLFSGIGGFRLGLEQYGHECVGFCEIDKYARQSYKAIHNTEGELEYHDITTVTDDQWRELKGTVDIIAGGFPCQAFSIAGKRQGFEDETRGTLFFEIMRAAKQIQPPILFLENVKGLLNHDKGRTFRIILQAMDELGYDAEWQVLNSKDFGVPQNRERVFIIGHLRGAGGREIFPIGPADGTTCVPIEIIAHRDGYRRNTQVFAPEGIMETLDTGTGGGRGHYTTVKVIEATKQGYAVAEEGDSINFEQPNSKTRRGRVGKGLANTLTTSCNQGVLAEVTNMDQKYIDNISENQSFAKKRSQEILDENGYLPDMYNPYNKSEVIQNAPTVTTVCDRSTSSSTVLIKQSNFRIRKLTPLECWRLQGFPDGVFRKAEQVVSNSQLYKQAGNSVTVNVIAAIAEKLTESNPIQR